MNSFRLKRQQKNFEKKVDDIHKFVTIEFVRKHGYCRYDKIKNNQVQNVIQHYKPLPGDKLNAAIGISFITLGILASKFF